MATRREKTTEGLVEYFEHHIERWHDGHGEPGQPLHEFLGLTWQEYSAWVHDWKQVPDRFLAEDELPAAPCNR